MGDYLNLADRHFDTDLVGEYNIPKIKGMKDIKIDHWKQFNYVLNGKAAKTDGIHFYIHDPQFERIWNQPTRYMQVLREYACVVSPDYSIYCDFPKAIQIYNHYRKHWLGRYWQENGVTVIPDVCWSYKESWDWCFDGEPEGSVVAVSNVGCMRKKETRKMFMDGYNEMLIRLQPSKIILFAHIVDDYKGNVVHIPYDYNIGGVRNDGKSI